MIRKISLLCALFIASLIADRSVYAVTFFDNFDDQTFTENNLTVPAPERRFVTINGSAAPSDYGFRGVYRPEPGVDANAVAIADNGNLFDDTGKLIHTIKEPNAPQLSKGLVGIASGADTVFNNFGATGPAPLPSTLLLLGTGLAGLAGIGRKK
jgi:hypothetical protein